MKHLSKTKQFFVHLIVYAITLGILAGALFLFVPKSDIDTNVSFLNVDPAEADSLLEIMTIEQKVAQLLFVDYNQLEQTKDSLFGAYFLSTDSLDDFAETYKKISGNANVFPFFCLNNNINAPNFFSNYFDLPNAYIMMSIRDTSLLSEYFDFLIKQNTISGTSLVFSNLLNNIADTIEYDTVQIRYYLNYSEILIERFISHNLFFSVPFLKLPKKDSVFSGMLNKFYDKQFKNGLPFLYVDDYELISSLKQNYVFGGIIVGNQDIFENYETFFESDFDVLITSEKTELIYNELIKVAKSKKKFRKLLDKKVKKILLAKIWFKQNNKILNDIDEDSFKFDNISSDILLRKFKKYSSIVIKNEDNLIPVIDINSKYQCFVFGEAETKEFCNIIKNYNYSADKYLAGNPADEIKKLQFQPKSNIIFVLNNIAIDNSFASEIEKIDTSNNLIIVNFSNTENIKLLENVKHLIHIWYNDEVSQSYAAQIIFGGIESNAQLPVTISDSLYFGYGNVTNKTRIGYDIPEMVGVSSEKLLIIDSIANDAVSRYIFPGCQVFAIKDGVVIVDKCYGFHTYDKSTSVKKTDLYDIASVTKVIATTLSAMKMYEQGKLPLDVNIERYFKDTKIDYDRIKPDTLIKIDTINKNDDKNWEKKIKGLDTVQIGDSIVISFDTIIYKLTPKNNIFKVTPRLMLTHASGIQPALPILKLMLLDNDYFRKIEDLYNEGFDSVSNELSYQEKRDKIFTNRYIKDSSTVQVAEGMYLKKAYFDTLWRDTKELPVWSKKVYIYSDVNMIILQMAMDSINRQGINIYTWRNFYRPLGLNYITFLPRKNFNRAYIVPTERDNYWRNQLIWGYVHDPSAALLGGVAGNAGLFSNAHNLGVVLQMLLNGGTYGGIRFLSNSTIAKFTATQPDSHRGLGFDKWSKKQICAKDASPNTYGHTGFTGCCVWVDPDTKIVFVFLSNRIHPSANNWKINKYQIRQKIHQAIYDALILAE